MATDGYDLEDTEDRFLLRQRELAARYRVELARVAPLISEASHTAAMQMATDALATFTRGQLRAARGLAERGLIEHPYTRAAPHFQHLLVRVALAQGLIGQARIDLMALWERHPDYDQTLEVLRETLLAAESIQRAAVAINLDAEDAADIIDTSKIGRLWQSDRLFYFLARHGDAVEVAPRATIGLARSLLLRAVGDRYLLPEARRAYDDFLDRFPRHPLVFDALCEQALTWIIAHRGPRYDGGILDLAESTIAQAEDYTANLPERAQRITRYRNLIARSRQSHDLTVARWHASRGEDIAARFYFDEVIARDGATDSAQDARREREELSPAPEPSTQP